MSAEVQAVVKVDSLHGHGKRKHKDTLQKRQINISAAIGSKKHKPDESRHFKFTKKRSQSFSGGKIFPPFKKRKKEKLIPPTKFLLGGNIRDPLNLNSLQDEEVNRAMNAVTPESSPLPTPQHRKGVVEVIIPHDINDPLSLAGGEEDDVAYAASFNTANPQTPRKVKKKNRKRRSKGGSKDEPDTPGVVKLDFDGKLDDSKEGDSSGELLVLEATEDKRKKEEVLDKDKDEVDKDKEEEKEVKEFKKPKLSFDKKEGRKSNPQDVKDRIVSPVIPQPGAWPGGNRFRKQPVRKANQPTPNFKESGRKFQYGNYNRYYGYRNPNNEIDPRLKVFQRYQHLFSGKDVLDIGCNTGSVSMGVARDLGARSVVGLDIDKSLVESARQRMRRSTKEFPVSMPLVYGPLDIPGVQEANTFPHNITFIQGNYVLENDVLVELEQSQFDVILCLSVTKWFHLNWGDSGLKRAFKRMFSQLRPGGILILEPQDWSSYKRKKNLTETTWKNYQHITLFPVMFTEFLLTEVGFSKCEVISTPMHPRLGFQRPIKLFTKGDTPLSSRTPRTETGSQGGGSLAATPRQDSTPSLEAGGGGAEKGTACEEPMSGVEGEDGKETRSQDGTTCSRPAPHPCGISSQIQVEGGAEKGTACEEPMSGMEGEDGKETRSQDGTTCSRPAPHPCGISSQIQVEGGAEKGTACEEPMSGMEGEDGKETRSQDGTTCSRPAPHPCGISSQIQVEGGAEKGTACEEPMSGVEGEDGKETRSQDGTTCSRPAPHPCGISSQIQVEGGAEKGTACEEPMSGVEEEGEASKESSQKSQPNA